MAIRKNNNDFTFWLVFDKVSKLCLFVRSDEHTLSFLLVVDVMAAVETSVIPDSDTVTVLLPMLKLSVVQFWIGEESFYENVLFPFTDELLLVRGEHSESLFLVFSELTHKLNSIRLSFMAYSASELVFKLALELGLVNQINPNPKTVRFSVFELACVFLTRGWLSVLSSHNLTIFPITFEDIIILARLHTKALLYTRTISLSSTLTRVSLSW